MGLALLLTLAAACGDDAPMDPDGGSMCTTNADCSDGLYCTGIERCDPTNALSDARGCVAPGDPCLSGQECSEAETRCVTVDCSAGDADGDGVTSIDCGGEDCDDGDGDRFPGNPEVCDLDGHDEDCDDTTLGGDADGDGYAPLECCNGTRCGQDCDDTRDGVSPEAVEACNGVDEDCDGTLDEGADELFYRDLDGDGFGDPATGVMRACVDDPIFVRQADDCDDRDPATNPSASEICDGRDNDCNAATPFDQDGDGDGHLRADAPCEGGGFPKDDCDDTNPFTHGGALERCSALDDDCDGAVDEVAANDWCTAQARLGGDMSVNAICGSGAVCAISACAAGTADCDGTLSTGCETNVDTDPDNCGGCGAVCSSGSCTDGVCDTASGGAVVDMVSLEMSERAVCGLTADGRAYCWGEDLSFAARRPRALAGSGGTITDIVELGIAQSCFCMLDGTGAVACFGSNPVSPSPVCNGTGVSDRVITDPISLLDDGSPVTDASHIAVSEQHGCVVRDSAMIGGTSYTDVVLCWGDAARLGDTVGADSADPVAVRRASGGTVLDQVTLVDAGPLATCAVSAGTTYCWGDEVVNGAVRAVPIAGANDLTTLSVGFTHACGIRAGELLCWGRNSDQVVDRGQPDGTYITTAVSRGTGWTDVEAVDGSPAATCATATDGDLVCWNGLGIRGDGIPCSSDVASCNLQAQPEQRITTPITAVAGASGLVCALTEGWPWCWGSDGRVRFGAGAGDLEFPLPVPIPGIEPPVQLEVTPSGGCARTGSGRVACWGDFITPARSTPLQVAAPLRSLPPTRDLAASLDASCALGVDGQVRCWGNFPGSDFGFLGGVSSLGPDAAHVIGGITDAVELAISSAHGCVIERSGAVRCWGESATGATGRIGIEDCAGTPCDTTAVEVMGIPGTPVELALGGVNVFGLPGFSCARLASGNVACWGDNTAGALGNGTQTASATPVLVNGLDDAVGLDALGPYLCAKRSNGTLACWGGNVDGTLGTTARLTPCFSGECALAPVRTTPLTDVQAFTAGFNRTCASTPSGDLWCWGGATSGQVSYPAGPTPTRIEGIAFPSVLSTGFDNHCALTDGVTRCWGIADRLPTGTEPADGDEVVIPLRAIGL